jgi:hypothetical protein
MWLAGFFQPMTANAVAAKFPDSMGGIHAWHQIKARVT